MGRRSEDTASTSRSANVDRFSLSATLDQYEVKEVTLAQAATLLGKSKRRGEAECRPSMEEEAAYTDSTTEQAQGSSLDWLYYSRELGSYLRRE